MTGAPTTLPIEDRLPAIREAMAGHSRALLVAEPGAGKTTRVPLALLDEPWCRQGKLLLLEPREVVGLLFLEVALRVADLLLNPSRHSGS